MALPRTHLLAIAGAVLSLMSFFAMRTLFAQTAEDLGLPLPPPIAQTGSPKKVKEPPPPRVEDVPKAVADSLAGGKVVVLLFTQGGGAEDAATSRSFSRLSSLGGRVRPFKADISKIGKYAGIVSNLGISQAPAVVIIRPDLKAIPPMQGYIESGYLVQRVKDQLP